MKLKITISGPKVHEVGYRVHLLTAAMNLALPGFSALNWTENGKQQVIALVEGDDRRIAAFRQFVEAEKPERAEVQDIAIVEYDDDVGRTGEYAMMCSFNQLNRAVPVLLEIRDDMKEMKGDIKEMKGDIKEMKGDIKEMKGDIKVVRRNTDPIPQILEELQPGYAVQFRQVQADIMAIK
ncbi:MAG: acylphosphatase, partial [Methanotrichaceae archaeon]|nr:acylphosphatase [Methanotrichaceae archaeon]